MTQVTDAGAELAVVRNGVSSTYLYSGFKSIAWFQANNGNYVVVINFLTDAAGNVPLKISLNDVDNQPGWTNDVAGAEAAVADISSWVSSVLSSLSDILSAVTNIDTNTTPASRTPNIASATGAGATPSPVYSLSIANVGAASGVINGVTIPAGVTINYDGGALNNTLDAMSYNATGTEFLIITIS